MIIVGGGSLGESGAGARLALLPGLDPRGAHMLAVGVLVPVGVGGRLLLIKGHWVYLPFS